MKRLINLKKRLINLWKCRKKLKGKKKFLDMMNHSVNFFFSIIETFFYFPGIFMTSFLIFLTFFWTFPPFTKLYALFFVSKSLDDISIFTFFILTKFWHSPCLKKILTQLYFISHTLNKTGTIKTKGFKNLQGKPRVKKLFVKLEDKL